MPVAYTFSNQIFRHLQQRRNCAFLLQLVFEIIPLQLTSPKQKAPVQNGSFFYNYLSAILFAIHHAQRVEHLTLIGIVFIGDIKTEF